MLRLLDKSRRRLGRGLARMLLLRERERKVVARDPVGGMGGERLTPTIRGKFSVHIRKTRSTSFLPFERNERKFCLSWSL